MPRASTHSVLVTSSHWQTHKQHGARGCYALSTSHPFLILVIPSRSEPRLRGEPCEESAFLVVIKRFAQSKATAQGKEGWLTDSAFATCQQSAAPPAMPESAPYRAGTSGISLHR